MSELELECSLCGRDVIGQAPKGCDICHGNASTQPRAYTLSDHRSGRATQEDRYGHEGGLEPKTSPLVVGGAVK
jgi:hypothetical protein